MSFYPEIEAQPPADIRRVQEQKLKELLQYTAQHSAFYQHLYRANNIDVSTIRTIEDLSLIHI